MQCILMLSALAGSPVVTINRALALAELHDARAGLEAMPEVARSPAMRGSPSTNPAGHDRRP